MMTDDALHALPKVELHRHLDGSVRLRTILDLAVEHDVDVKARTVEELARIATVTSPMESLEAVLSCFGTLQSVLCSASAMARVTYENIEDAWNDGVRLLELRFAPAFIAAGKDITDDEIISGVMEGLARGMERWPMEVGLIGILPRALPLERNAASTRSLIRWRKSGHPLADRICGFDLADGESATDPAIFVPLVDEAREAGMGITIHSGENTSAQYVERTLDLFRPSRIGHGLKAWESPRTVERLKREGVMLELCPTSNWLTRSVPSREAHPLPLFHRAGVEVSINSDDPNLMGIDLAGEYALCRDLYGFTEDDFKAINEKALAKSFLPEKVKRKARERFFA